MIIFDDQKIITNFGICTINNLVNSICRKNLEIKNFYLGENNISYEFAIASSTIREGYYIELSNGLTTILHPDQKIKIKHEKIFDYKIGKEVDVGDFVYIQESSGLFGNINEPEMAFLLGQYQADGTNDEKAIIIDLWENDFDLINVIEEKVQYLYNKYDLLNSARKGVKIPKFIEADSSFNGVKKVRLYISQFYKLNFHKTDIPEWIWRGNKLTQWEYIKGLYYADGTVTLNKERCGYLSICSIHKEYLKNIQLILFNLGIKSSLSLMKKAGTQLMPDQKGNYKLYPTKDCWRLVSSCKKDLLEFEKNTLFLSRKNIILKNEECQQKNTKKYYKIIKIEKIKKLSYTLKSQNNSSCICNSIMVYD